MRTVLILAGTIICGLNCSPARAQSVEDGSLILFGANWCVPCVAELRDLARISALSRPIALKVAWLQGNPRIPRTVIPGSFALLSEKEARGLFTKHGEGNAGLPLAVMLDDKGRRCAFVRARLDEGKIAAMRQACAQKPR